MSKEVIATGAPLFVKVNISFETYRVFPVNVVQEWMSASDSLGVIT